jgi:DNA relaxase NicK
MADSLHSKFYSLQDHCSRIDLTITAMLDKVDNNVALRAYNGLQEQRKMKTTYIVNNRGGATFYSGSRSSRRFGRVYDKGAESGNVPGLVWRYEVEYKKPISDAIYALVNRKGAKRDVIRDEVTAYFASIGIEIPGSPTTGYDAMEVPRNLTNMEKKLQWLEKQVQPAIRRLVDEGYLAEIYQALGLEPLSPDYPHLGRKDSQ